MSGKSNTRKTQPMDPRSIVTTNLHAAQVQRVMYTTPMADRFFPYDDASDEDPTISPGDPVFYVVNARILGNTHRFARTSYVTALLNNVEVNNRALKNASTKLNNFGTQLIRMVGFTGVATDLKFDINVTTKKEFQDLQAKPGLDKFAELLLHCAIYDYSVRFQGLAMSDTLQNAETKNMKGELQVAGCQHGAMSPWNSGDGPITQGDDVYLWIPPQGNPRGTNFKPPAFQMRSWSETRKGAVLISGPNFEDKIIDALTQYMEFEGLQTAAGGNALQANAVATHAKDSGPRARLRTTMRPLLRTVFRSSYVGKCLTAYAEQRYYFDVLRLM
jgi:hypothetical protein